MTNTSSARVARPQTPLPVQAKLKIGAANDPLESEADDIADGVMRMPDQSRSLLQRCPGGCPGEEELRTSSTIQRCSSAHPGAEIAWRRALPNVDGQRLQPKTDGQPSVGCADAPRVSASTERAIDRHRGAGAPLPASTRHFFEPRFGARFDNVRVHTDADAGRLADGVSARAFTVGRDIFFGQSEYRPGTTAGRRLLAHELTHTIQQSRRHQVQRQLEEAPPASAREIYETYQSDLIELGKELYRLVSESAANAGLVLQVLDEVPWLYRDDVAYYFVEPLSEEQLLDIASDEQKRDLLGRFRKEMEEGAPWPSEKHEIGLIDQALEATAPAELLLPAFGAPHFPSAWEISDLEGQVTKKLYSTLEIAWSWLESDPSATRQLLSSIQDTVETMSPLIKCANARGDDLAAEDLDNLAVELQYAVAYLTDKTDHSFEAMRENFEWIAQALKDLDPTIEGLERAGSVGICVAVVLLPFAEGIIESLTAIDPAQARLFSSNLTNNPFFRAGFTLGAVTGILTDAKDVAFSVFASIMDLTATAKTLREATQQFVDLVDELFGPTGADVARGLGRGIGTQLGAKLAELNKANGPFMFAFELGQEVGPAIVYTVLSLLGFEQFVAGRLVLLAGNGLKSLKGFPRLAYLFKRTPDAAAPLPGGTPEGGLAPTSGRPEASRPTPATLDEIIRADGIVLSSGHRIRIVDGMLTRCSNCSVLARVYRTVLQDPNLDGAVRDALRKQVDELQRDVDEYLSEGFSKEEVLREFAGRIGALGDELDGLAARLGKALTGRPSPQLIELLETSFPDQPEAIRLLLEEGQGFAELLVSPELGAGARLEFIETWRRRHGEPAIRNAVIDVMSSGVRGSKLETALRQLRPISLKDARSGQAAIDKIVGAVRKVRSVRVPPGRPWVNQLPDFLTADDFNKLPDEGFIPPNRLRFSQDTAYYHFDDGRSIQETVDLLSDQNVDPDFMPAINIVLHDGKVYTLDHRRVIAAQAAAMVREGLEIRYRKRLNLTADDVAKLEQTDGISIRVR